MSYNNLALIEALAKIAEAVGEINTNYDPQSLLDALKTVDGDGSGLDSDMVDGLHVAKIRNSVHHDDEAASVGCGKNSTVVMDTESWGNSAAILFNAYRLNPRPNNGPIDTPGNCAYSGVEYAGITRPAMISWLGNGGILKILIGEQGLSDGDPIQNWLSSFNIDINGVHISRLWVNGKEVSSNDIVSQATPAFTQTIPPGVWTTVEYGTIVYNPVGAYNSATYQFIAPEDGFYHVQAAVNWDVNGWSSGDIVRLALFRSGANLRTLDDNQVDMDWDATPGVASAFYLNGGCDVWLNSGNAVDIRVWHNASASVDTYRYYDRYNRFSVHKIS